MQRIGRLCVAVLLLSAFMGFELSAEVTNVVAKVTPESFSGKCPTMFTFEAVVVSNSAGKVKVQWKRSDNAVSPVRTLIFREAGKQVLTTTWQLGKAGMEYEGWQALAVLSPNAMMSNKAVFRMKCDQELAVLTPVRGEIRRPVPVKECPDPAAIELRFSIVSRSSQFRARVRITGVVKNIGNKNFQSGPNQASAYLYEIPMGGTPILRAQQAIVNLATGASIELNYERDWDASSPNEGEFPPNYRLTIGLDPDIYMDGNTNNDDCSQENNNKERNGMEMNTLVRS